MTTETTTGSPGLTDRCIDQAKTALALLNLIRRHPTLPAPHITIHEPAPSIDRPSRLDLQLDTPADFEAWRAALYVAPGGVTLHLSASHVWLAVDTWHAGIRVHLSGFNVPLTAVHAQAPRDRSAVTA